MEFKEQGIIKKVTGGLYTIELGSQRKTPLSGQTVCCRARGAFRHAKMSPLVGDRVEVRYTDHSFSESGDKITVSPEWADIMIGAIGERKNALIRPPMANLELMFVTLASASPEPSLLVTDKLIAIAEYNGIEPIIVVGKGELSENVAKEIKEIYEKAGYPVYVLSCKTGEGVDAFRTAVREKLKGKIAAFAGASGVGKSTLMNTLFPGLGLGTGDVSRKTERGKQTTRTVELFSAEGGYIADTPGFSMLDFERFDFFSKEDLPETFREFRESLGECKYKKCTHLCEDGCAIVERVRRGEISVSRHESYRELYSVLKNKHDWDNKQ
ncbi:MAG: ribosome small subunit-dependent GTPase A [Ruminococcaceae bacterium]|nr:ribosome small subunit-dependent GTPase A [Oscillospiraceae bacterium]